MRLIDGDKLIDIITNSADLGGAWGQVLRAVKDAFIRLIRTMPNVNPEPHWIPCSERLPEKGARVLVSDGEDVEVSQLGERYRDGYVWEFETCWNDLEDWPYWMPLPEPWKGE